MRLKIVLFLLFLSPVLHAQRFSVATDILDYAALGTLNVDGSYAFSRHFSAVAGVRYNPFTYNSGEPDRQFQHRQFSLADGGSLRNCAIRSIIQEEFCLLQRAKGIGWELVCILDIHI